MWQPICTAPYGCNLELSVIERDIPYPLVFPCRRVLHGWVNAETMSPVDVHPTHWRPWPLPEDIDTDAATSGAQPLEPCDSCGQSMVFVTTIARVTEPGMVRVFECMKCEKLTFLRKT
jgi:hypothetical protein